MTISKFYHKISFLLFFFFLLSFFFINVEAVSFKFLWENTTVEIPLGDSIENYKYIPLAKLYRNGLLLSDSNVTYNTEGDWLFYSKDINTYKLGTYKVWYKAYDSKYKPGTCSGYKALVNFVVKDIKKPSINIFSDPYLIRRGRELKLENNFNAFDDDCIKEVKLIHDINSDILGDYSVTVVAIDNSNNQEIKKFNVTVYENSYPEISTTVNSDTIEVPLNGNFDIKSIFKAYDRVDLDITNKIIFDTFYDNEIKEYDYTVKVENSCGLMSKKTIRIKVVDKTIPVITLLAKDIVLDYKTDFNSYDFKKYIKEIIDDEKINYDRLEITHNIINEIGSYVVTFTYNDGYNKGIEELRVLLISSEKPIINTEEISISKGEKDDIKNYLDIIDESDPNIIDSVILYDNNVDYDKEGSYIAEVYCINSSGISNTKKIKINVSNGFINGSLGNTILIIILFIVIGIILLFLLYYFVIRKYIRKKVNG